MTQITLSLFEAEVRDIIRVLNNLPTGSNAYPLVQKIVAQLPAPSQQKSGQATNSDQVPKD